MSSRHASFHDGGVSGALLAPLKWLCVSLSIVIGLILAAWIIDWVFVAKVWPEGLARLKSILEQDLARLSQLRCWCNDSTSLVVGTANFFYWVLFQATGVHDMATRFSDDAALSVPDTIVRNTYISNLDSIQTAMVATQLFGVRLATLLWVTPLFALVYGVALIDGLVQRAIRRASGGHESGSLYHRAKHLQLLLVVMSTALILLLPYSFDLCWVAVPVVTLLAILVSLQWKYYKKHA